MLKEIKKRKTQAADVIQSLTYELYFKPGEISILFIIFYVFIVYFNNNNNFLF